MDLLLRFDVEADGLESFLCLLRFTGVVGIVIKRDTSSGFSWMLL